jgi:mycofactocin precursor
MPESATELLDPPADVTTDTGAGAAASGQPDEILAADLLVEEISIDGMCGVY